MNRATYYIAKELKKQCFQNVSYHTRNLRMPAQIIDGKTIAQEILDEIKNSVNSWINLGNRLPHLTTVIVGNDAASHNYIANKLLAAKYVGISANTLHMEESISEGMLVGLVKSLNDDKEVDGVLVQLPLPSHIDEKTICNAILPSKDVDGFHFANVGKLFTDTDTLLPCTAMAVVELLKRSGIETFGKHAVVCGRSKHVGLPIAVLLQADGKDTPWGLDATVTICNRYTPPSTLTSCAKMADIIVSAVGIPGLIKSNMIKPGACVIDVGLTRIMSEDNQIQLVGDVDFAGVSNLASYITPVPGGVGPMTVAMLMLNTVKAAKMRGKY